MPPILTGGSALERKPRLPKQVLVDSKACHPGNAKNSKDTPTGALLRTKLLFEDGGAEGIVYIVCASDRLASKSRRAALLRMVDNIVTGARNVCRKMRLQIERNHSYATFFIYVSLYKQRVGHVTALVPHLGGFCPETYISKSNIVRGPEGV